MDTKAADIHRTLEAEGFAVLSVRLRADGTCEVVTDDRREEAQARADELNAQWEPEEPEPNKSILVDAALGDERARAELRAHKAKRAARAAKLSREAAP